jgi:hypothetical protein
MQRLITLACAIAISLAAFSSCSNDPTLANGGNGGDTTGANINFQEIDRIGKPGIKELFLPYATHDAYNRAAPANDIAAYGPSLATFIAAAGRSAAVSAYVRAITLPDVLVASLSNPSTTASYLGWETGGRIADDCTGSPANGFGGRGLNEDVVDTMLGLVYGNTATTAYAHTSLTTAGVTATVAPDDGAEQAGQNGKPNLTSDGVTCVNRPSLLKEFPYLANPV